jgi:hypothetical protein
MRAIVLTDILAAVDDVLDQLRPALQPGERIVWSGRPDPTVIFTVADAFLLPFYIVWTSFAVIATVSFSSDGMANGAELIPILFDLIGFYFLIGRFIVKAADKRRTAYAITNRRAIVVKGRGVAESPIAGIQKTSKRTRDGRHMTVTFGTPVRGILGYGNNPPNAGLDFMNFMFPAPVASYDVADVEGLSSALASASVAPPATQSSPN